ncbi:hypothetical protein A1Q1_07786 [Trichosporon asahii var. asahii CBS 2479]|uniref:Diacylglycerol O-acyltransferase n=1 Tax=Trichosporon asahii var. asahii (strain ATCC 90039 / CBS 2479 / JCM 2466 / KCTC 7840 / NBRC 103889/ NCYC 2677 / UAMH 7654) TaxID=1186058 RepID=J6F6Q2_TRIAS|nr:hypothetical protein A1Q1_07786 [Trichosporon asahii var. asahii CBS 2479]EJT50992.1 hypothetical protein A1Q1_07786 [Trichosporon asahii var. asahii CBS 2479]
MGSASVPVRPLLRPELTPVTYHERYSLMRQNTGFRHVILWVVTYPSASLPPRAELEARVEALQSAQPILHARLSGTDTNKPGYVEGAPWPRSAIVRQFEGAYSGGEPEESLQVYRAEMERFSSEPLDGPMWCVGLYSKPGAERSYLTLAFNHLVIDGRGSSLLLTSLQDGSDIPEETLFSPTRADDTIPMTPTLRFLAPIVFRELLLPKFPLWVQAPFTKDDPWPGHAVEKAPFDVPQDIRLLSLTPEEVKDLKVHSKANGVKTLHPLLKAAYMIAIWYVHAGRGTTKVAAKVEGRPPLRLGAATARDERDVKLGHSALAHNYVTSTEVHHVLSGEQQWWPFAAQLSGELSSDQGLQDGRMTISLLGHVQDPDIPASKRDPALPTGWEQYFHARAASPTPYRESLTVSNLGLVKLPPGASDMIWGQTASPYGAPYYANIVGHEGGIRITSTYREGSVTDTAHMEEVHEVMRRILNRVAKGEAKMTLEEIAA